MLMEKHKIISYNLQSIGNCLDALQKLVEENEECKVICATEHWKMEQEIKSYNIVGYTLASYYCRGKNEHGGSAIYVKNGIKWLTREDICGKSVKNIFECSAVELWINRKKCIILSVYHVPNQSIESKNILLNKMEEIITMVTSQEDCNVFIAGGFGEKTRIKRPRATSSEPENDVDNDLDERNNPLNAKYVPPGFLSPSVIEYLELGKSIPGRPGTDYPVLGTVPYTNFYCDDQPYPGFFADEESRCQTWHYCDIDGRQTTFLCPNGTQFSQSVFVCDWWFNVRCDLSSKLYVLNSRLYGRPKLDPTRPHRTITKQLLENIFNDEENR